MLSDQLYFFFGDLFIPSSTVQAVSIFKRDFWTMRGKGAGMRVHMTGSQS